MIDIPGLVFLGVQQAPIVDCTEGATRIFSVAKRMGGAVRPIAGKDKGGPVMIPNSEHWPAPDITVARAEKSRVRGFGRNWKLRRTLDRDRPTRLGPAVLFRLRSSGGALHGRGQGAVRTRGGVLVRSRSHRV